MIKFNSRRNRGFTLPTVVIASIIMLSLLLVTLQVVASTKSTLEANYYNTLAREATEAGGIAVDNCFQSGKTIPLNVFISPVTCQTATAAQQSTVVLNSGNIRTSYRAQVISNTASGRSVKIDGTTELLRTGTTTAYKTFDYTNFLQKSFEFDPAADRASKRFWYFGLNGGGLDFGVSGSNWPTPVNSGGFSYEGSTVITDRNGDLVFWTNGSTVWNKNRQIAWNATGLLGSDSATQAVAAFPLNQKQTRFGIVTNTSGLSDSSYTGSPFTPAQKDRLYLSVYDTTLDSGRGGIDPAIKNVDIASTSSVSVLRTGIYSAEALNAMPNQDGSGYWVYTYSGAPYANRVTGFLIGVDAKLRQTVTYNLPTTPILCDNWTTSGVGTPYGTINFSKDYSKMLLFMGTSGCARDSGHGGPSGSIYILRTNSMTGALVQEKTWITKANYTTDTAYAIRNSGYSADFSPNEQYVYVTQIYPGRLTRYSLSVANPGTTQYSLGQITRAPNNSTNSEIDWNGGGQVRRGPDGRMYIASNTDRHPNPKPNDIICITNPDHPNYYASIAELGLQRPCTGVRLPSGTYSWFGLPQMVTVYQPKILVY